LTSTAHFARLPALVHCFTSLGWRSKWQTSGDPSNDSASQRASSVLADRQGAPVRRPAVLRLVAVVARGHGSPTALARASDGEVAAAAAVRGHLRVATGAVVAAEVAGDPGIAVGKAAVVRVQWAAVPRERGGR